MIFVIPEYTETGASIHVVHVASTYKQARAIAQADVSKFNRRYERSKFVVPFFIIGGSWYWGEAKK